MITTNNSRSSRATAPSALTQRFSQFAHATSVWSGNPLAFLAAVGLVIVWVLTGPIFNYSDTWQLVINTGTTIVTFLMVFLIQNTQNRDTLAIQLKLSELVLAMKGAENKFAAIEDLSDEELERLHNDCRARAEMTLQHLEGRKARPTKNGSSKPRSKTRASGRRPS
jgi:low affinity Fe/Cu permease